MILVKITKGEPGLPAGEDRLLPDDLARKLVADGRATNPRDRYGEPLLASDDAQIEAAMRPGKHKRGGYETK